MTAFPFRGFGGCWVKNLCRLLAVLDSGLAILSYTSGLKARRVSCIGIATPSLQKS